MSPTTGRRSRGGATWVTNRAMPTLTGTENARTTADTSNVP